MNQDQIIELLREATNNDKHRMLDALTDGQALLELGITDHDTEAVECAYAFLTTLNLYVIQDHEARYNRDNSEYNGDF
jgi:hypothetical protein